MKLRHPSSTETGRRRPRTQDAFTLVEVMVSFALGMLIIGGASTFIYYACESFSGITAQNVVNGQAGNAFNFIESRARLATSISNDASGNILTLGFDDNPNVDSDGNGKAYDDKNHFEQFKFLGVNTTNSVACSNNSLIYIPDTTSTNSKVLITKGVRNLPNSNIFSVTNTVIAIVRFGIADNYTRDNYQAVDIQGTAVSLNRPTPTNFISILP